MRGDITQLLDRWRSGDSEAAQQLTPLVYSELRRLASAHLRREHGATMQPTDLVHEAFLRLMGQNHPDWQGREHFYSVSSKLMRQVLVDRARQIQSTKRGQGQIYVPLERARGLYRHPEEDLLRLDEALDAMGQFSHRMVWIVEHYYFSGLSSEEIAELLGLSAATIRRQLRLANAWLRNYMTQQRPAGRVDTAGQVP